MKLMRTLGKLGLGLAALEKIRSRRCSSLSFQTAVAAAAGRMKSEQEVHKGKSLYLCFLDSDELSAKQIVRPITWNDSVTDYDEEIEIEKLTEVAYKKYTSRRHQCSKYGSLILFPGIDFLKTCWLDTSTRPLKFQILSDKTKYAKDLTAERHKVTFGEVDGKLYRIDNHLKRFHYDPDSCAFQVLDPAEGYKWSRLSMPPFIQSQWVDPCIDYGVLFFDAAKKIIGWNKDERRMFCFDTTKPEMGWTCLAHALPFWGFLDKPIIVSNHHPRLGDFHLMFTFHRNGFIPHLSALFVSNNFDTFRPINAHICLPIWCFEYTLWHDHDIKFVHLGDQKIALVLHGYENDNEEGGRKPGYICVVEFKYKIVVTNAKSTVEIKTRLTRIRCFKYQYNCSHFCVPNSVSDVRLNGAFLI